MSELDHHSPAATTAFSPAAASSASSDASIDDEVAPHGAAVPAANGAAPASSLDPASLRAMFGLDDASPVATTVPRPASAASNSRAAIEQRYPGPQRASTYFSVHQREIFAAIHARLAAAALPEPHERLRWAAGPGGLAAAFEPALLAASGGDWNLYQRIPALLYPADPWRLIDEHRALDEGRPGELRDGAPARGPIAWNPLVGQALAVEFEAQLRGSLTRMGARYVAQADAYAGAVTPGLLVTSHPFDRVVARLLCDPAVARFTRAGARARGREPASDRGAFRDGLRLVIFEWLGARDPALWNWIEVTEPRDATREDVAASLFERHDGENHTEYAYGLTAAPPLFRVPARWARAFPQAAAHAPARALANADEDAESAEARSALDVADSRIGDDVAIAQAAGRIDPRRPMPPNLGQLAKSLEQSTGQLALIGERLAPWKLSHLVGPALRWATRRAEHLNATPDATLRRWAPIIEGQRALLFDATRDLLELLEAAERSAGAPDAREARPFRDAIEAFAIAFGESHLVETAAAQLVAARQARAMLPLALLDQSLRESRAATAQLAGERAQPNRYGSAGSAHDPVAAEAAQHQLARSALELRAKASAGGAIAPSELEAIAVSAAEEGFRSRLATLDLQLQRLKEAVWATNDSTIEGLANLLHGELSELPRTLSRIQNAASQIGQAMSDRTMAVVTAENRATDPDVHASHILFARKQSVAQARRELAELAEREQLQALFQRAHDAIRDAQIRAMILEIALLIGVSVIGGAAGSVVGGAVRGALLAEAAADTAAFVRGAATARTAGAIANVATDAAVTAFGQSLVAGDSAQLSFIENLVSSAGVIAALRPLHAATATWGRLDEAAVGMWKVVGRGKALALRGGVATAEMVTAAAAGYVAARLVKGAPPPSDQQAAAWAIQGASIAVGRLVSGRLTGIQQRLALLAEQGMQLSKRAAVQQALAADLEATGRHDAALRLLDDHVRLLEDEAALLRDPARLAGLGLDPQQLASLRAGNQAALDDTHSRDHATAVLHLHGLEPIAAGGAMWSGTPRQIEEALRAAGGAVAEVARDPEAGRWTARIDGQAVSFLEVRSSAPAPREATPALGEQLASLVPGARYDGAGGFRIEVGDAAVDVEIRRIHGAAVQLRRTDAGAVLDVPRGLAGIELERAVASKLTELRHQALRHDARPQPSGLGPGGTGERLSAADHGAIAELRVLRQHLGDDGARAQIDALERRLGLHGDTEQAASRRRAVDAQLEVQRDATRRDARRRELDGERGHPGIELHSHLMGVVQPEVFRQRAATVGGAEDRGSWVPLVDQIAKLPALEQQYFQAERAKLGDKYDASKEQSTFSHKRASDERITRRAKAGDAVQIVRDAQEQLFALRDLATTSRGEDRAAFLRGAEYVAEEAAITALSATPETPFDGAYAIRDALVKTTFGGGARPGESTRMTEQRAFDDLLAEAVLQHAHEGIAYSEQSTGLNKLAGSLHPDRVEAAIQRLVAEGRIAPGAIDIRMLGMLKTADYGGPDPRLGVGAPADRKQSSSSAHVRERDRLLEQALHPGTVGGDIGGPEHHAFNAEGVRRIKDDYRAMLAQAIATGTPRVLRPHVGEGAIDTHDGKPFHTDKDRHVIVGELSHYGRARENLETMLRAMGELQAEGTYDPTRVFVRFGHATHATPMQASEMARLGIMAEVNLGSNVSTGSLSQTQGPHGPRSTTEQYDDHALPSLVYYGTSTVLSTDGQAVMRTSLRAEYQRAHRVLEEVLAGDRTIRVGVAEATLDGKVRGTEVPGRPDQRELHVAELTRDERARFERGYEKLYADAESYYLRRPQPGTSGDHHARIALERGLVSKLGTATFEGSREAVQAAIDAYRASGYHVTSDAGPPLVAVVRSRDDLFSTTLSQRTETAHPSGSDQP